MDKVSYDLKQHFSFLKEEARNAKTRKSLNTILKEAKKAVSSLESYMKPAKKIASKELPALMKIIRRKIKELPSD